MEMAATAPNVGVDSPTINHIVPNTHTYNVGMPAEPLDSAVEREDEKCTPNDEGKTTLCCETSKLTSYQLTFYCFSIAFILPTSNRRKLD